MRRPQSAKPGHRNNNFQPSFQDFRDDHSGIQKINRKHHVKLMKPDLTTNDFGRIMPKKIHQDKERLYSQALQLKQSINEITQENIRLKTRITILEKQKDKMNRYIESNANQGNRGNSRLNVHMGGNLRSANNLASDNKENLMVRNLKKMVRDSRQEIETLKQENQKIKKAIKYTRINELEIERKMLLEENHRINRVLVQLNQELADKDEYEHEIEELKNYLEEEVEANRELSENNQKYLEYIEELEDKLKNLEEKKQEKQKKMQRQNGLLKRKNAEFVKINDDLRKENRELRDKEQHEKKKNVNRPLGRPVSSNPYTKNNAHTNSRSGLNNSAVMNNTKELQQIKNKNKELQKQLEQMRLKLQKSQNQLQLKSVIKEKDSKEKIPTEQKSYKDEYEFEESEKEEQKKAQFILTEDKKVENIEPSYEEEFQKCQKLQQSEFKGSYDDKFESESPAKEKIEKKADKVEEKKQKKSKSDKKDKKGYKPDKKMLTQIKQLLTYRMKAQRYPYTELQKDINASEEKQFSVPDLKNMMSTQPFYLTQKYTDYFLQYCQQSEQININKPISVQTFLQKIHKLIKEFTLMGEEEQEQILLRIAQMTTQYPEELSNAFENIKNGPQTVSKDKLIEMFKKLELADQYIEAIIAELSLCSEDLEHLNFRGFFERFYIEQDEDEYEGAMDNPINEQQIESSGEQRQQTNKKMLQKQIPKIDEEEEYQDDKVNFIMDDEAQLSMGMKNNDLPNEEDMVSDDGRI